MITEGNGGGGGGGGLDTMVMRRWGVLQDNLVLSTGLIILLGKTV